MTLSKRQVKSLWKKVKLDKEGVIDELNEEAINGDHELVKKVDLETLRLRTELAPKINLQCLFESTIEIIDMYYICAGCGHIYWVSFKAVKRVNK